MSTMHGRKITYENHNNNIFPIKLYFTLKAFLCNEFYEKNELFNKITCYFKNVVCSTYSQKLT